MPVYQLPEQHIFPPVSEAERNGLLGIGGDLHPDRLFKAYHSGIFPWYSEGQPILWFAPNPRFVLPVDEFRVSRSIKKNVRSSSFEIRINTAFAEVIEHCSEFPRTGQFGTWITEEMKQGYILMNQQNRAHSFEAWQDGVLVGGLYGVLVGGVFAGESMFAHVSNASKVAFVWAVRQMSLWGVEMIDCQVYTDHLARFGAREVPRVEYMQALRGLQHKPVSIGSTFDDGFFPL